MKLGAIPRSQYPEDLRGRSAVQVFVGGCYQRGVGSKFRAKAHAHYKTGWICFRSDKWLGDRMLILHELAHLISGQGHNDRWRKVLLEIGGTLEPTVSIRSYAKVGSRTTADVASLA